MHNTLHISLVLHSKHNLDQSCSALFCWGDEALWVVKACILAQDRSSLIVSGIVVCDLASSVIRFWPSCSFSPFVEKLTVTMKELVSAMGVTKPQGFVIILCQLVQLMGDCFRSDPLAFCWLFSTRLKFKPFFKGKKKYPKHLHSYEQLQKNKKQNKTNMYGTHSNNDCQLLKQ